MLNRHILKFDSNSPGDKLFLGESAKNLGPVISWPTEGRVTKTFIQDLEGQIKNYEKLALPCFAFRQKMCEDGKQRTYKVGPAYEFLEFLKEYSSGSPASELPGDEEEVIVKYEVTGENLPDSPMVSHRMLSINELDKIADSFIKKGVSMSEVSHSPYTMVHSSVLIDIGTLLKKFIVGIE